LSGQRGDTHWRNDDEIVIELDDVRRTLRRMNLLLRPLLMPVLLLVSCAAPVAVRSAPPAPTVPPATVAVTTSVPTTTAPAAPVFAAAECTSATATTRQVIERYFALSTSNNAQAVIDCFAKVWRDKHDTNPTFADSAALWSQSGPATNVVVTPLDVVNGCDRFRATAQMRPDSGWMKGQTGGQGLFSVGPEAGRMRIYEIGTALVNASATTLRCG
jgi:ABC-type transport system substrate-binding protein